MSDQPIKAGDLVQVVRSCCDHRLGLIFTVIRVTTPHQEFHRWVECGVCGRKASKEYESVCLEDEHEPWPTKWLKRIPPLSELEGVDEKMKEPA